MQKTQNSKLLLPTSNNKRLNFSTGESPLTERELNLAEVVVDKWKCYLCTSFRVGVSLFRLLIVIIDLFYE